MTEAAVVDVSGTYTSTLVDEIFDPVSMYFLTGIFPKTTPFFIFSPN